MEWAIVWRVTFLALAWMFSICSSDQKYYANSIGAFDPLTNLNLELEYVAHNTFTVSGNPFAGTNNTVYVTFVGDFSSSGPHAIAGLQTPSTDYSIDIHLERDIGKLTSVWVENPEYDSLLLSAWKLRIRENVYELAVAEQWLETFDPELFATAGDGFSPDADLKLPSESTWLLPVARSYLYYTETGIYTRN